MDQPRLLVVEDDEAIRTQLKYALQRDFTVSFAQDRLRALTTVKTARPQVILLDLGLPLAAVRDVIAQLGVEGVHVDAERVERSGIRATKFRVRIHGEHPEHGAHVHEHGHRAYADIRALLERSALDARVRAHALAIFARLAEAEGHVHGVPAERVEFHEVGALDAIVDVVGTCTALELLASLCGRFSPTSAEPIVVRARSLLAQELTTR